MIERRARRRRDGSPYAVWRVRWYEGKSMRSRTFDSAGDARAFEGKVRTAKRAGELAALDAGRETLAEFAERWWDQYAIPNLERSTLRVYALIWNRHVLGRLGHLQLREVTPEVITRLRADLERAGVGPAAIRKTLGMLQGILQRAVEWQRIAVNPAAVVRKPPARRERAVRPLAPTTIEALRLHLLGLDRPRDATLVSVLAYAGVRPQEALGLRWQDVRERTLLVERAIADGEVKGQKTGRPPRTVGLLGPLRQDLAEWRLASGRPDESALVFPGAGGRPWRDHDWRNWRRRVFEPAARACGTEGSRPYDLRHSFASLMIAEGRLSIVELAAQLGHKATMTLDTYAHVIAELQEGDRLPAEAEIRAARERRADADATHIRPARAQR